VIWLRSADRPFWLELSIFKEAEKDAVIALLHPAECFDDQDYRQYRRFLDREDPSFTLRAPGRADIPARLTQGFYTSGSERLIALCIGKADYAGMQPGVGYSLVPKNEKPNAMWAVGTAVKVRKE